MAKLAIMGGKSVRKKPFQTWPIHDEEEIREIVDVVKSGNWSYHAKRHTKQTEFAYKFAKFHDAKYGICVASGTAALEVTLKAAGTKPGDEVIVPALTFVATASAPLSIGAVPIFVDVDPNTYCIDCSKVEEAITGKTKAIIPVHLYCNLADMDDIMEIAQERNLIVIEDCCHVHGAKWRDRGVGSIGDMGCFSFQQSKVMTSGEGGIVITNDKKLEELCSSLIDCGRVRENDEYAGNVLGWNYRITEFQAAILLAQLKRLPEHIRQRERNAAYLSKELSMIEGIHPIKTSDQVTRRSYYRYIFKYDSGQFDGAPKSKFLEALYFERIPSEAICDPVYRSPLFVTDPDACPLICHLYGKKVDYSKVSCPVAEKASYEEAVAIPHEVLLSNTEDMDDVVYAVKKIKENSKELHKDISKLTRIRHSVVRKLHRI